MLKTFFSRLFPDTQQKFHSLGRQRKRPPSQSSQTLSFPHANSRLKSLSNTQIILLLTKVSTEKEYRKIPLYALIQSYLNENNTDIRISSLSCAKIEEFKADLEKECLLRDLPVSNVVVPRQCLLDYESLPKPLLKDFEQFDSGGCSRIRADRAIYMQLLGPDEIRLIKNYAGTGVVDIYKHRLEKLSRTQLDEVFVDLKDELNRRKLCGNDPCLQWNSCFLPARNEARKELSRISDSDLVVLCKLVKDI